MPKAIALSVFCGLIFFGSQPLSAAPLALSDHAAVTKEIGGAEIHTVGKRSKVRRNGRRYKRSCGWQCRPYWRPYQYRYWKFYYPFGGPLF